MFVIPSFLLFHNLLDYFFSLVTFCWLTHTSAISLLCVRARSFSLLISLVFYGVASLLFIFNSFAMLCFCVVALEQCALLIDLNCFMNALAVRCTFSTTLLVIASHCNIQLQKPLHNYGNAAFFPRNSEIACWPIQHTLHSLDAKTGVRYVYTHQL